MFMLDKVMSGGQTGADIAGLKVAREFNIPTGGWIPRGFLTQDGYKPEYKDLYNLTQHKSDKYPPRTFSNVRDSDGTMRFASDWDSSGEICTLKGIIQYRKPYFDVDIARLDPLSVARAIHWLNVHKIKILNVAGNAAKTCPYAEIRTSEYLRFLLKQIGHSK
jgi:hypothetical protein